MIEVRELTKRYGAQLAVDGLTFDVSAGRVTGFLGNNGAGKSTTLRMIVPHRVHRVAHIDVLMHASRCYSSCMRTTVTLDDDVAAEVERLRRESGLGVSEALNSLARVGVGARRRQTPKPFSQKTSDLGLRVDVANIGDVLDLLDEAP